MNVRRVVRILSIVLLALSVAQLVPIAWALYPFDPVAVRGLVSGATASLLLGLLLRVMGRDEGEIYRREGVLVVVGAWLLASIVGAIPYVASGAIPGVVDAFFESASGFTTTGASILTDIEVLPRAILFWRSLTQWLGGIGIVVLFVALLSELGPGARFLFKLEVTGPKTEILHARVQQTARVLFRVYLALSVAQVLLMLGLGATLFDALTHTFATISTGGFSPYGASAGHFGPAIQAVLVFFMLAAGVNIGLYAGVFERRAPGLLLRDVELRVYLALAFGAAGLVALNRILGDGADASGRTALDATFQVVSILTSTGFATADFAAWPGFSQTLIITLMLIGGCAGSTAGGAKVIRFLIGLRVALREVRLTFSPNAVVAIVVGDQVVPEESARSVIALLVLWVLFWGLGAILLSIGGADLVTAATASLATLSNIGPGLGAVGPAENFADFAAWQKILMVLLMWLGRLEFFAVLALMAPRFWRH